ncbi:hypothetical protein ACOSP7_027183 [Xanthoceras sorbifolium]
MSSPSDRRRHKAGISGPSNKGGCKLRSFDDALIDYERFVFDKRIGRPGDATVEARSRKVISTKVQGDQRESAEVSSSENHGESKGRGLDVETGSSSFPFFGIIREILVELVHTFLGGTKY